MKNMKKIAALTLSAVMSLSLLAACGGGTTPSTPTPAPAAESKAAEPSAAPTPEPAPELKVVEAGKLHMATNAAFPPYEMLADGAGVSGTGFEGIDVEVADAIAKKLGLELVVDDQDFDAALLAAQNGQSDIVMAGVTVTDERKEVMNFTDSYAKGVQVIIVTEDSPIATVDDLANAGMIGTQTGTTGYIYCSGDYGDDHVMSYDNGATAIQALLGGQVDAVVIDNEPAKAFVEANEGLKILDTSYADEDYAIGVSLDNEPLLEAINGALKELTADGTLASIVEKYIPSK